MEPYLESLNQSQPQGDETTWKLTTSGLRDLVTFMEVRRVEKMMRVEPPTPTIAVTPVQGFPVMTGNDRALTKSHFLHTYYREIRTIVTRIGKFGLSW